MTLPAGPLTSDLTVAQPADVFEGASPEPVKAADLGGFAREFVLFTPALLYTHGGLDRDLVQEYVNVTPGEVPVMQYVCRRPVFAGLPGDWARTLLATPRECWEGGLRRHLATAEILDRGRGVFYRTFPFSLVVADPAVMDRGGSGAGPPPTAEVIVFGLDGNAGRIGIRPARVLGRDLPTVSQQPPDPKTVAHAFRLMTGQTTAEAPDPATVAAFETLAEAAASDKFAELPPP